MRLRYVAFWLWLMLLILITAVAPANELIFIILLSLSLGFVAYTVYLVNDIIEDIQDKREHIIWYQYLCWIKKRW